MSDRDDWYRPPVDTTTEDAPTEPEPRTDGAAPAESPPTPTRPDYDPWDRELWSSDSDTPFGASPQGEPHPEEGFHHPLDKVTGRLPRRVRLVVDWVVTIVGAIAIVLAIKAWVVNPYRIPSSSMEPTLHCARPATGCEARFSDRVLANRFIYHFRDPERGEIVVFKTTPAVVQKCSAGGTFVKRIIGLPGETVRIRLIVDWVVTIVGAIAIVLAIKAWVVNPYRIPSSSMEPTLHCARPATGCEARFSDRVLANRFIYHFRDPQRGEIVVFKTTPAVVQKCSAGGTFVKRIIGLPGETVRIRLINGREFVYINGRKLDEPYVQPSRRGFGPEKTYRVPQGQYFLMGDNRSSSCDSRQWGGMPRGNILGKVFATYWPPQRISFR